MQRAPQFVWALKESSRAFARACVSEEEPEEWFSPPVGRATEFKIQQDSEQVNILLLL